MAMDKRSAFTAFAAADEAFMTFMAADQAFKSALSAFPCVEA